MNDVNRLGILQDVIDRRLTTRFAANRLEISDRHCRRLLEHMGSFHLLTVVVSSGVTEPRTAPQLFSNQCITADGESLSL